jgi:ribosomal protein L11 methylase PrmA
MNDMQNNPASFRDPDGHIFSINGQIFRQVNLSAQEDYDLLISSGLYAELISSKALVEHEEAEGIAGVGDYYKIIMPEKIPFISYPYEWSFSQLKQAAILTLKLQITAMARGMSLKDASAYNIQFIGSQPIFIDTLSFEKYNEGKPWIAYGQFVRHFLAPLALMAKTDARLSTLLRCFIDGVPVDMAAKMLPGSCRFNMGLLLHLFGMARAMGGDAEAANNRVGEVNVSRFGLMATLDSLLSTVNKLTWEPPKTTWSDYYDNTNYTDSSSAHKAALVLAYMLEAAPKTVWDLGANSGRYSEIGEGIGAQVTAFDFDVAAVEFMYLNFASKENRNILPLVMDLSNPSPALGWHHNERASMVQRGPADCVLALALIHHLAIANNLPLGMIANFFSQCGKWLIIEFVPKEDSQIKRMLTAREDIFVNYTREEFERAFGEYFYMVHRENITDSCRTLYLLCKRDDK